MKKLLLAACLSCTSLFFAQEYSRAKILTNSAGLQQLAELGIGVDHGTIKQDTWFVSDFSAREIQQIRNAGFEVEILIVDVQQYYRNRNAQTAGIAKNAGCQGQPGGGTYQAPAVPSNFNLGTMAGFYTYQEFLDEIDSMAAHYPSLITARTPISTYQTAGGRPIYFLRMSDNPETDEAEPEILYTALHHAREPNSLSELVFYMWYLLENYATNEEIAFLIDNTELYFVPMINPDGYVYNETTNPGGGGMWRKNRRNNGGGVYGVDLNRNYSYGWGTTGTSSIPLSDTYCGTAAFSEPETQAIKWLCENRDFVFAFNAHTYGNDLLHPIGVTAAEFAVDHDYFQAFTHHMTDHNGYGAIKSSDLYPASGDSDDYMYKSDLTVKPQIFALTPEIGPGFWPASSQITGICQDMVFPNMTLAHLAHKYYVVKDFDASTIETITGNFTHSAYRLGQEDGAVSVSITPLSGIQSIGAAVSHDLAIMTTENGSISYMLDPMIQYGDEVSYVLNTEYGPWTKRDTIRKTFGAVTSQLLDDASAPANWTGNWSTTTSQFVSPSKSFTDSPTGDYNNSSTRTYTLNQTVDLTHVTAAAVRFYAKWEIEDNYDYCQFQVSTDDGDTWTGQCGLYTNAGSTEDGVQPVGEPIYDGTQSSWILEEISLSDYIGQNIRMRFILQADGGLRMDGFYYDDFEVMYNVDYTGMDEQETGKVHVMPNPANTVAQISFDKPVSNGTISVYNLTGELVHTETVHELTNKIGMNTESWSEGMYTVRITRIGTALLPAKLVIVH